MVLDFSEVLKRLREGEEVNYEHLFTEYTEYFMSNGNENVPLSVVHLLLSDKLVWDVKLSAKQGKLILRKEGDVLSEAILKKLKERSDYLGLILYNALHLDMKNILSKEDTTKFQVLLGKVMSAMESVPELTAVVAAMREQRKKKIAEKKPKRK